MSTLSLSARFGLYTPTYGPDPPETGQTLVPADGWKKFFFYNVLFDDDAIYDAGTATVTIPTTGIYYINFQLRSVSGGSQEINTRILANGTTQIAFGSQRGSTGSDEPTSVATYAACLDGGTTLTFEGEMAESDNVTHMTGYLSLLRLPVPFAIADLDTGPVNSLISWDDVCNQPSWLDPGAPTRWTVAETGFYFVTLKDTTSVPIGFTDQYWRIHEIHVNGVDIDSFWACGGANATLPVSTVLQLTAGDYVEIYTQFKTGAPVGLSAADMTMYKIPAPVSAVEIYKAHYVYTTTSSTEPTFDTSVYDTDGYWAGAGDKSKLVVPTGKGGRYLVWAGYYEGANRAINYFITGVGGTQLEVGCSCSENYALGNYVSPTSLALWDLADGDSVQFLIENGDAAGGGGPGSAYALRFGMVKIDGWTYEAQHQCPCPSGFLPQIYRWLKK